MILFGNEEGTAEIASELGINNIADIERNEYGTPLVSSMFKVAQNTAKNQLMCYVNADIILISDFLEAVQRIHMDRFLVVGQRWDLDLQEHVSFDDARWESQLRARVSEQGRLHPPTGLDYFVFPRGMYQDMPAFAVGRPGWDNWMVYRARSLKIPVIDATEVVTAVHQNHDYSHHPHGKSGAFHGPEAERNKGLLGGWEYSFCIRHVNRVLTPQGVKRALKPKYIYAQLDAIPALFPRLHFLGIPKRVYIAISKWVQEKLGMTRG